MTVRFGKNSLANPGIVSFFLSDILAKMAVVGLLIALQIPMETTAKGLTQVSYESTVLGCGLATAVTWLMVNLCDV